MKTGRPVKITLTREEVFYCHRGRHPVQMRVKTGVKKDGSITAMHFRTALDGGGYGSYGVASLYYTGALQTVTYRVPRYKFEGVRVFTNKPPCGPKRGHGTPQPRFALECHLDKICARPRDRPGRVAPRNTVAPGTITANQMRVRTMGSRTCLERVIERSGWRRRSGKLGPGRGIGIAGSAYISGAGLPIYWNAMPHSGVQLKVDRGGGVTVFCGSTDIGQGSDSVLAYVVAEELGIRPDDIRVVTADTDLTPVDLGSYSSRVTLMTGNAAIQAARRVREPIFAAAAKKLGVPVERLRAGGRRIWDAADEHEVVELRRGGRPRRRRVRHARLGRLVQAAEVGRQVEGRRRRADADLLVLRGRGRAVGRPRDRASIRVDKVWIAHDVGRSINPLLVIGQVEGGVYMGLGEALMEEQVFRKGLHKFPSLLDYKSPTTLEMPPVDSPAGRDARPRRPLRRQGVRPGPAAAGDPGGHERALDALGHQHRRGAGHPREGPGRAGGALPARRRCRPSAIPRPWWSSRSKPPRRRPSRRSSASMLRLPPFRFLLPKDAREAASMLADHGPEAMVVAGGTDLYPNMKRRQFEPKVLVSLRGLTDTRAIAVERRAPPGRDGHA